MSRGLNQDLPHGPERDYEIMVAAQTTLLAGGTLANKWFLGFGLEEWKRWAEKFIEISKQQRAAILAWPPLQKKLTNVWFPCIRKSF